MHIPAPTSRSRLVISAQSSLPGHGDAASFILDLLGEALAILKKSIYCEQAETNLNPFLGRKARLDRHLLMAKRLFCCWAAALVAGFTGPADLPLILPSAWADGGASMAVSSASGLASSSQTTGKKQRTRKKQRALSPFVQLAQQITGDAPLCDHEAVIDDADLSSNGINCLSQEPGLRWVFTPSPWSGSGRWEDLAVESPNAGLRLQPLSVAFAPFSPWFPVDSVFFVGEDRLFEPLDPMGTGEGGQMSGQGRTGEGGGMLGQILRHLSLCGWNRSTPGEEMIQIAAIGTDGVVGQSGIDIMANQAVAVVR